MINLKFATPTREFKRLERFKGAWNALFPHIPTEKERQERRRKNIAKAINYRSRCC